MRFSIATGMDGITCFPRLKSLHRTDEELYSSWWLFREISTNVSNTVLLMHAAAILVISLEINIFNKQYYVCINSQFSIMNSLFLFYFFPTTQLLLFTTFLSIYILFFSFIVIVSRIPFARLIRTTCDL